MNKERNSIPCAAGLSYLMLIAALMFVGTEAFAQADTNLPTRGKRFWTGFMQNGFGAQSLKVHVLGSNATSGTVSIPQTGWSSTFSVAANSVAVITVPISAENLGSESVQDKGVLIQTQDSVNVFISSFQNFTHDLSQVLPENALGNSYRVDSYQGLPNFNNLHKSELLIVSTTDGTQVRITPSVATLGGVAAGVPFTVDLNAGQTYQVQAAQDFLDLTGTVVEATEQSGTCRPFAVLGGSTCATAPSGCSACDAIFEQLVPRNAWGTRYFTAPVHGVSGSTYRIMADEDNTVVTIGAGPPFVLNSGQRHEVNASNTPVCIEANKPVSVAQLLEGYSCAGSGDPSLLLISPAERRSTSASFQTLSSSQLNQHSIGLVVSPDAVGQITLDGAVINPGLFLPYAGCSDRLHAKLAVASGVHRVQAESGFQLYVFGLGYGESYAASAHDIGSVPVQQDSTVCGTGTVVLNAPEPLADAFWTAASAPNTVIGTGNSLVVTPTSSESYQVTGTQALTGCPRSFSYNVGVPLTIPTLLTVNDEPSINICQYEPVQLALIPPPDPAWFNIAWGPANALNDPTISDPLATPMTDTWFTVSVTSPSGCGNLYDSVLVSVIPGSILSLDLQTDRDSLCLGESCLLSSQALRVIASDRFDPAPAAIWTAIQGGAISTSCGSVDGAALYFNGNGQRAAQTIGLNTLGGGQVRFHLKIADGVAPCADADPGEDVRLEYSTNNGFNWVAMATFAENAYPTFTSTSVTIPVAAQTSNTMFRLRQLSNSGAGQDNWAIDEFMVTRFDNNWLSYTWTPGTVGAQGAATTIATPTTTGWYTLNAIDPVGGCAYSDSVHIHVDPAFNITVTTDTTLCDAAGLTLLAVPSFPTSVSWNWGPDNGSLSSIGVAAPTATPQATTTYTVSALTASGCSSSGAVTVTVGQLIGLAVQASTDTLCQGQSTTLTALATGGGNLSYSWSGAGLDNASSATPSATPSQTTTYTCIVTEPVSGCALSASVTVVVNTGYTANAGPDLDLCTALGHQLSVQHNVPNATYQWTPGVNLNAADIQSPSINNDVTATYMVTVTDPFGCSVSDQVTITRAFMGLPDQLSASACAGQPMLLSAPQSGSGYLWNTGQTTSSISPTTSGNYTLTTTNALGCQGITTFLVTLFPLPAVDLGPDLALCGAVSQVLDAGTTGNGIVWTTGAVSPQISVVNNGTYGVTVTDGNGCSASDTVTVQFNPLPSDVLQDVTTCITAPPTLHAGNPGSSYLWSSGQTTQAIVANVPGTYNVTVTTPENCSATYASTVVLMPALTVVLGNDTSICQGQSLLLDAGPAGTTYSWSTGHSEQSLTVVDPGSYSVSVSNGYCSSAASITVNVLATPTNNLMDAISCVDQLLQLDAGNPDATYLWSTGGTGQVITATGPGNYSVTVTSVDGCADTFSAAVQYVQPPTVQLGPDTVLCQGQVLQLDTWNPGSEYLWSTGSTSSSIAIRDAGTYSVIVTTGPCVRTDALAVLFDPSPERALEREVFICLEDEPRQVLLHAGNSGSTFLWSTGATTQSIVADDYGPYHVDITNSYNCVLHDSILVSEFCPSTIFLPNTFTPNGDGMNDVFIPVGKNIASMELLIFDRWGTLLFESRDPTIGWDGTYRGELVKNDMYAWRVRYRFMEQADGRLGMEQEQLGHIQVLR